MKSNRLFYIFTFSLLILACKPSTTEQQDESSPNGNGEVVIQQDTTRDATGHDFTFLTDKLFLYKASHIVGQDSKVNSYEGQWIDLVPDGTYKAGHLKKQTHTGKWIYDHERKTLELKPDDKSFKMSEWTVMHNIDMMVWVGTQKYGNNATQIQLTRSAELP